MEAVAWGGSADTEWLTDPGLWLVFNATLAQWGATLIRVNIMSDRRFTDREVALVLRRAAELDKASPGGGTGRGLSVEDLREIAAEVGIEPSLVTRAVEELESRGGLEPLSLLGPPAVRRETRAVPAELTREQIKELIRIMDRDIPAQGTVTEALDSVRWNSSNRTKGVLVAVEPGEGETILRVEEGYGAHIRQVCHFIPMTYGLFGGLIPGLELGLGPLAVIAGAVLGTAVGYGIGDGLWRAISAGSARRVRSLAAKLADEARRLLPSGGADSADSAPGTAALPASTVSGPESPGGEDNS
jgi:DNA-binding MarR family transcriptional regulator